MEQKKEDCLNVPTESCADAAVGLAAGPDDVEPHIPSLLLAESPISPSLLLFGDLSDFEMASDANRHVLKRKWSEKMEDHEFLKRMRFWDFNTLRLIMEEDDPLSGMIKELHNRGCVVTNISPNAAQHGSDSGSPLVQDWSLDSSGEVWQSPSASVRKSMLNKGLYQKHSVSHPLLKAFSNYLEKTLANDNFKQEVENVARFLFFMNPVEPSLEFVWQPERVWEYVIELKEAKQSRQTIQNYLKSIRRFLKCHTEFTNLCLEDKVLHYDCETFLVFIDDLQSEVSRQVIKATRKRYERSPERSLTPAQCCAVLEAARADFLQDIGKLSGQTKAERQRVLYYLEAVLVLKHLQRPGVVQHMTVGEWLSRKSGCVSVKVKAAARLETFTLSQEEEIWFEMYFRNVRPVMVGQKSSDNLEEISPERFFISSTGKPIYKVSNDVKKLHLKYKLPNVTSEMARCASQTAKNLREMQETSASSQVVERSCLDEQDCSYDVFVESHPVTVDGTVPEKPQRVHQAGTNDPHYDRWLSEQMKLRVEHVLECFRLRQPSEKKVRSWIKKQGWTVILPDAAQILSQWKPSAAVETAMACRTVRRMIRKQRWKGLELMETGVFTTRPFARGEVVCDYHSRLISREEGLDIHNSHQVQAGHLFFFTSETGRDMCFDAHDEHCECHPNTTALGRHITHSSKRANVRPRLYGTEDAQVLLFIACRDIKENEQLRYDYGSNKKSFAGEDLDLLWF